MNRPTLEELNEDLERLAELGAVERVAGPNGEPLYRLAGSAAADLEQRPRRHLGDDVSLIRRQPCTGRASITEAGRLALLYLDTNPPA
jgi:hypothetical protein